LQNQAAEVANVVSIFKLDLNQQMLVTHAPAPVRLAEVKKLPVSAKPKEPKPDSVRQSARPKKLAIAGNSNDGWEEF
jgi:hypothetical protein